MSSIDLCLHCSNAVVDEDEAVICDSCEGWQHIRCNTGISRSIYQKMIQGHIERQFICYSCQDDQKVKALTAPASVQGFVLDFESAAWSAIRRVFPEARISGCAFHWEYAVWRKVLKLGLSGAYQQDEGAHMFVRKLLALPLLPAEHIESAFNQLQLKATEPLQPLIQYMSTTWIEGNWPLHDWSVYGQSIRTNIDCEGWHRRLNFRTNGPPPFYCLVEELHKESLRLPHQIRLVSERKLKKVQRKTTRSIQKSIFDEWDEYEAGTISTSRLLRKLSHIYGPPE